MINITKGDKSQYECIVLNGINQENIGDTSKWNIVKKQILNIGKEICGNKKLEHKQQWVTENDIAIYKLLDREIRQECKQAKEDHYNHMCEEIEELDKNTVHLCH